VAFAIDKVGTIIVSLYSIERIEKGKLALYCIE